MILRSLFFRPARRKPLRFAVTILGVAVGVASLTATIIASRAAVASLKEGVSEIAGKTKLEIRRPGGVDVAALGRIRDLARDAAFVPIAEEFALVPALKDNVRLLGIDVFADQDARELPIEGGESPLAFAGLSFFLRGQGVLIAEPLAKRLDVKPGQTIDVSIRSRVQSLRVLAVLKPKRVASAWDNVVVLDISYLQALYEARDRVTRIDVIPRPGVELKSMQAALQDRLGDAYSVGPPDDRVAQTDRMVASLRFNLSALSGISLLVGAILVATTLATSVVQRRETIALLRSLGASQRSIAGALIFEAACIGLGGGVLGVVGGWFGAQAAADKVRQTYAVMAPGIPATDLSLPWWLAVGGVALGLLVSMVAVVLPLHEAMATPPIQNLRSERPLPLTRRDRTRSLLSAFALGLGAVVFAQLPPWGNLPVFALCSSMCLLTSLLFLSSPALDLVSRLAIRPMQAVLGISGRLALAALSAGRRRAAWAIGAIAVASGLAVSIATMVESFRVTVQDWTDVGLLSDVWIRPVAGDTGIQSGRLDNELVALTKEFFGAENVDAFHTARAFYKGAPITLSGAEWPVLLARGGGPPFRKGERAEVYAKGLGGDYATISESFANRYGVGEGDRIRIQTTTGEIEREIIGVLYSYGNSEGLVVLNRDDFLSVFPDEGPAGIAVFLEDRTKAEPLRDAFREKLGGKYLVEMRLNAETRREAMNIFDRSFAITKALQMTASVVAVIAALAVLFALVNERRQDLALIKALGGSRAQVAGVVLGQAGVLGLLGAALGLGVGLLDGLVLVKVLNVQSFGWTLRFLPPWGSLIATMFWIAAACLAAGIPPAIAAMGLTPRSELRDE